MGFCIIDDRYDSANQTNATRTCFTNFLGVHKFGWWPPSISTHGVREKGECPADRRTCLPPSVGQHAAP